ncbi:MAG: ribonuclease E/G, partial [Rhizobium leguminosarum]
ESQRRKRRRRGKRGGRRNRAEDGSELTAGEAGEDNGGDEAEGDDVSNDGAPSEAVAVEAIAEQADEGQAAMAAVESATVITEDVKPARSRGRRKPAAAPVEEPVAETSPVAEAEPELVEASADLETSVQEEAKPVRANRESNISSSEPTVKSTRVENGEGDDGKPKKAGWWQRRGFF